MRLLFQSSQILWVQGRPRGVSFRLPKCGVVGLLGPNGAGKSTMIRMLAGVLQPILGRCSLEVPLPLSSRSAPHWVAPRTQSLPLHRTVQDWVVEASQSRGHQKQAFDALDRCDLALHADRPIGVLSKGWRQLVALRRPWHQPEVLILDEPSTEWTHCVGDGSVRCCVSWGRAFCALELPFVGRSRKGLRRSDPVG